MPNPKAAVTQSELRRYLRAMREAGFDEGRVEIAKPDGTKVSIVAGKAGEHADGDDGDDFDAMIGRVPRETT